MAVKELSALKDASTAEVELAKQSLKGRISRENSCTTKRLEERTKSLYYLGETNEHLISEIDSVSLG